MFDLGTLASLQELGFFVSSKSMMLPEESSHRRPSWREWVMVGCKRRTLMSLFCFEWMNAMLNNFATFPCNDASFLPAPSGKVLWGMCKQSKWEVAYDRWLGRWAGLSIYTLGDLTGTPPGPTLDLRSEMWLEEADEFGMMFMTLGEEPLMSLGTDSRRLSRLTNFCQSMQHNAQFSRENF
jgi:hypothetical protein